MNDTVSNLIQFDLVSPEKKLLSEEVAMVVVPGEEGDFGVLQGHAPTASTLRNGIVSIYQESEADAPTKIFVAGGFADVTDVQCTILAEYAVPVSELKMEELEQELANLNEDMTLVDGEREAARLQKKIDLVEDKKKALLAA